MDKQSADKIIDILARTYPDAKPALVYHSEYELLVCVILSAQCTDERVNKVTEVLFQRYNTPQKMLTLDKDVLGKMIYSCGLYNAKAEHILSASKDIVEKFGGKVPSDLKNLQSLSGVGRKTANVVYSVAFGGDAIAVDTHVFRVSNRIGLAKAKDVLTTEKQLMDIIDKHVWSKAHHYLIWHGRKICTAQSPKCNICPIENLCEKNNLKTKSNNKVKADKK